ncbi:MAG: hypothetical protein ABI615_04020 [Chthoniobacterales bacterium]
MRSYKLWRWLVLIPLIAMLLYMLFPAVGSGLVYSKKTAAKTDVVMIKSAILAHGAEYNTPLPATHAEIMKVLLGDNPRKITFLDVGEYRKGKGGLRNGIFLDPWGTAYVIDASDLAHPKVYSPGPDKKAAPDDPQSDDIQSWK